MNGKEFFKMSVIIFPALAILLIPLLSSNAQQPSGARPQAVKVSGDNPGASTVFSLDAVPAACPETFIDPETEGPYYKTGSPERIDLIEEGTAGESVTLTGYVFDKDCKPVAGAWLDFWHADGNGVYDNAGYKLRGHQLTDQQGRYILKTVLPGEYTGRTNHIHVKVSKQAGGSATTSQLYFPEGKRNAMDRIFNKSMLVTMGKDKDGKKTGFFNFKLNQ
jgi:protocatechuate 3,4-dioxygenase beta subunit